MDRLGPLIEVILYVAGMDAQFRFTEIPWD